MWAARIARGLVRNHHAQEGQARAASIPNLIIATGGERAALKGQPVERPSE
jgi:hypothetical protein